MMLRTTRPCPPSAFRSPGTTAHALAALLCACGAAPARGAGAEAGFTDVTPAEMALPSIARTGPAWADFDGDGLLDLLITATNNSIRLFLNDGAGSFVDASPPSLLAIDTAVHQAVAADYDNDGDTDLYVVTLNSPGYLLRNDGHLHFTDVTPWTGSNVIYARAAAWADVDGDGRLDLYINTNGLSVPALEDKLYRNYGDDVFWNVGPGAFLIGDNARGAVWADFDNDGDLDLYAGNGMGCPCAWESIPQSWIDRARNRMYRNDAGVLVDVTSPILLNPDNARGVAAGDYDNDGDLDLFVANLAIQGEIAGPGNVGLIGGYNRLFRNDGDFQFTDATTPLLEDRGFHRNASWVDFDNDGLLDLHTIGLSGTTDKLFRNLGGGQFEDVSSQFPGLTAAGATTRSSAWADFDRDGRMDVVTLFGAGTATRLLRNTMATDHHWLVIEPTGTVSNRSAIGTRVTLLTGRHLQIREVHSGSGYWSQNMLGLHFGLGRHPVIDRMDVRWPGGRTQTFFDVPADRYIALVEPACPADLTGDGTIGFDDLLALLSLFGEPAVPGGQGDVNGDGTIGFDDLLIVLAAIGTTCD